MSRKDRQEKINHIRIQPDNQKTHQSSVCFSTDKINSKISNKRFQK